MGLRRFLAAFLGLATLAFAGALRAQACCAGAGAVTPGRLAMHEDALVGVQVRAENLFGSYDPAARYHAAPAKTAEWEFEQNIFGAIRILPRAQLALLVPIVQTYRKIPNQSATGGGLGDVNLSGRYDFTLAGASYYVPGIAALAGVTFPTGRSIETAEATLGVDATGIGTYQANLGLAFEQTTGPWLFGLSGLVAKRASRTVGTVTTSLAAQWTLLASTAYTFSNDAALAALASYAVEGEPEVNGQRQDLSRRFLLLGVTGIYPFSDRLRALGGVSFTPPFAQFGRNTPARLDFMLSALWSWS